MEQILDIAIWAAPLAGLAFAAYLSLQILKMPDGTEPMRKIATAIQKGAMAFLRTEYTWITGFVLVVFVVALDVGAVVFITVTGEIVKIDFGLWRMKIIFGFELFLSRMNELEEIALQFGSVKRNLKLLRELLENWLFDLVGHDCESESFHPVHIDDGLLVLSWSSRG